MRGGVLFVHNNFPGQFKDLAQTLMALERPTELLDLAMVKRPPARFPPEPLRTLTVRAVLRALRRVDAGAEPGFLLQLLDRFGLGFSF